MSRMLPPAVTRPDLERLLKEAAVVHAKLSPLQRAINALKTRRGYVASEMTVDSNDESNGATKEQNIARMNASVPEYIVLTELERLQAILRKKELP